MKTLRPIKGSSKTKIVKEVRYVTADIESHHWINFLVIALYDGEEKFYKQFVNLKEFLKFLFQYCADRDIKNVFFHFGGKFDHSFILEEVCFGNEFWPENIIPRGSGLLSFDVKERVLLDKPNAHKAIYRNSKGKPHIITMRDSSALLPFALKTLCTSFNVPIKKGEIDHYNTHFAWENKDYTKELFKAFYYDENYTKRKKYKVFYKGKLVTDKPLSKNYSKKFTIINGKKEQIHLLPKNYNKEFITYKDLETGETHSRIYNRTLIEDYLKADCISLYDSIAVFYKWPLVKKAGLCFTTASQAVKIWQTYLDKEVYSLPNHVDSFVRSGYFGGRTEIFKPIFESSPDKLNSFFKKMKPNEKALLRFYNMKGKKLNYYDVNSLYPTVMQKHDYPIKFSNWTYTYDSKQMAFWDCDVDVPEMFTPPLGVKVLFTKELIEKNFPNLSEDQQKGMIGSEKLIFPIGKFRGIWTTEELEYAKSIGVKVLKVYQGACFHNGGRIFKTFIDSLYAIRLEAKKNKDPTNDLLSKLIMNSCYGRLGLNVLRENLCVDIGQEQLKSHMEIQRDGEIIRLGSKEITLDDSFTNVAISAYVTSYARIHMMKIYRECGEDLFYTDTDSLFTTKEFKTGEALGELKVEYRTGSSCFLLPKTYINEEIDGLKDKQGNLILKKITMKGFDKKKIKGFTIEDFTLALAGEMKQLKVYQEPKFATLKSALQKGMFLAMNYCPDTSRKVAEQKEKGFAELLEKMRKTLPSEEFQKWIKTHKGKYLREYGPSFKQIHSLYDKRVIIDNGTTSIPIKLGGFAYANSTNNTKAQGVIQKVT